MKELTAQEIATKFNIAISTAHRRIREVKSTLEITNRKIYLSEYCDVFKVKLD